nr:MarR family transcriptional regulator [Bacteroidota bacterium]
MKNLIHVVAKLSSMMGQMEEAAKEKFNIEGLTLTQMHYLEAIHLLGNPNITELAHLLKLTKPTVKVSIDKLIEKDYIFKVQSDADRRSAHLHVTEKGKLINQMHDYAHKCIAKSIEKKLDSSEKDLLIGLLSKVLKEK